MSAGIHASTPLAGGRCRQAWWPLWLFMLITLATPPPAANALSTDFDDWPTTSAFGDYAFDGWSLRQGEIRGNRPGFGSPITGNCAWLANPLIHPETGLQSPVLPRGVATVSLAVRRNAGATGETVFDLEHSTDGVQWTATATFTNATDTWTEISHPLERFDVRHVRVRTRTTTGVEQYLGIENVVITEADGVFLDHLRATPPNPTFTDAVHIELDVRVAPLTSNLTLVCRYRPGPNGSFEAMPMDPLDATTYRTREPLPPRTPGDDPHVYYYIAAHYDGPGQSPVQLPAAGSEAPAAYRIENPYLREAPAILGPSSRRTPITITEIMYHPQKPEDPREEFVELFNTEPVALDISGYTLRGDATFTFPPGTLLPARGFLVIAGDPAHVAQRHGIGNVTGPLAGRLSNAAGTVELRNRLGAVLLTVDYADTPPWPKAADGAGHSLVLTAPERGENNPAAWSWSAWIGGSPGRPDPAYNHPLDAIRINEIMSHTDLPDRDFVELFNRATQAVDLTGCLINTDGSAAGYVLPSETIIPPRGILSLTDADLGFAFSKSGDNVYLFNPERTRVIDAVHFGAKANGASSGRYPDGEDAFVALAAPTPGTPNTPRLLPDVIFHEIMFNPISGDPNDAFIELFNRTAAPIALGGWRLEKGVDFSVPPGIVIPAGGYLVIAHNAAHLIARYPQLTPDNCIGDWSRSLSGRGERLVLSRPDDPAFPDQDLVTVDDVTYHDGWGDWADGDGSSLELIDARADRRHGSNWADSDESAQAPWTLIEQTGVVANGQAGVSASSLHVMLMHRGECLIDNVEVLLNGHNVVANPTFEGGLSGWSVSGSHERSTLETTEGYQSARSLRIRASARGGPSNRVTVNLNGTPIAGQTITIRLRARWVAGWPVLVAALNGNGFEASGLLEWSPAAGTPGLPNNRGVPNAPPAIEDLTHFPALPAALEPVAVSARVDDPDGLGAIVLKYRLDPNTNWVTVAMNDAGLLGDTRPGDGIFTGRIPGQPAGTLAAFRVEARDAADPPAIRWAPAPPREALVRFGATVEPGVLANYRLWLTQASIARWNTRDHQSDEPLPATFVYDGRRPVYSAGIRYRGGYRAFSGPTSYEPASDPKTPDQARGAFHLEMHKRERLLGSDEFKLDAIGQITRHYTIWGERHTYWLAEQLDVPYCYPRFIHLWINDSDRGTLHDLQTPSRDFVRSWNPTHNDPQMFKMDGIEAFARFAHNGVPSAARYRSIWPRRRSTVPSDDYTPVHRLVDIFNVPEPDRFEARAAAMLDLQSWIGFLAVNRLVGNEDTWGYINTHNAYLNATPGHRARLFLYDMDWSLGAQSASPTDGLLYSMDAHAGRLLNTPRFQRHFWRILKEAVEDPMTPARNDAIMDAWYAALTTNQAHTAFRTTNQPPASPDVPATQSPNVSTRGFVDIRRQYIQNQMGAFTQAVHITNNGGLDFSVITPVATLTGYAPVHAEHFRLNGREQRLAFPTVTNWTTSIALESGANPLHLEAFDRHGRKIGEDAIVVTLLRETVSPVGQVVINEIHYHPAGTDATFVELHNRSSVNIELGGWRLNGLGTVIPGGTLIEAGAYRVIASDLQHYYIAHTNVEQVIAVMGGSLDRSGEKLQLLRPLPDQGWEVVSEVRYAPAPPWPPAANGTGASLQLRSPALDPRQPGSWAAAFPTPGAPNTGVLTNTPPHAAIWINEIMPDNRTTAVDNAGEADPWIELINTDTATVHLAASGIHLTDALEDPTRWAIPEGWTIPPGGHLLIWADGQPEQTAPGFLHAGFRLHPVSGRVAVVQHRERQSVVLDAVHYEGLGPDMAYGAYPDGDPLSRQLLPDASPGMGNALTARTVRVVINEWMADNKGSVGDPTGGADDWFELYNLEPDPVNLGGYRLNDNITNPNGFTIPGGTWIDAHGFLLVWADGDTDANAPGVDLHVSFKLDKAGEAIALFAPDGSLVDGVTFGPQPRDGTEGRWPDGAGPIWRLAWPTPGAPNAVLRVNATTLDTGNTAGLNLAWDGQSGTVYRIDRSDALTTGEWRQIALVTGRAPRVEFHDPGAFDHAPGYYRIRHHDPP